MSCEHTRRSRAAAETLDMLYHRAVARYLEASGSAVRDHLTAEELAQDHAAEHAEFEHIFGAPKAIGIGVIEAYGGVAEVTSKPENVGVEIVDRDNEA